MGAFLVSRRGRIGLAGPHPARLIGLLALLACAPGPPAPAWTELFDGVGLADWQATRFGGEGRVEVVDGSLILRMGEPLTGVTWTGALPPGEGYEIEVVAARRAGTDFFCALTFPVGDAHCSLVAGGWGGSLTGLSVLDGEDASTNGTAVFPTFVHGQDYTLRVQVRADRIEVWLDAERIVSEPWRGRMIGVRPEVALSRPLGIASYATTAAIAAVRWRLL
ncbi:MAG TPA: DUF1080 domain-containing protein [Planctomycetota bacterium]